MPITPTEKIWMNGELVPWADAQVHILTHSLHYGTGCSRASARTRPSKGPAVFRLTEHIERLFDSAHDHDDGDPVHGRRARAGDQGHRALDRAAVVLHPADRVLRLRRDGSQHVAVQVDVAIACWPWGAYLGDDAVSKGVRMKISSWTRHDHNTMPPLSKTTGNYVNSSLAKVEALKAGYDEAIMLNPDGLVSECTGENIFAARRGVLDHAAGVGGRAARHHAGLGHDDRARPRLRGARRRPVAQRPLRRRGDVRVRHRGRGERGELGRRPRDSVPGPDDARSSRPNTPRPCAGEIDKYKDWCELV